MPHFDTEITGILSINYVRERIDFVILLDNNIKIFQKFKLTYITTTDYFKTDTKIPSTIFQTSFHIIYNLYHQ